MTEIQAKLLDMLAWFDAFCRENGLRYYALGGTMLGAVRHQGFIPWDDDVDVGMPRKDYECLARLMGNQIRDGYMLETEYSEDPKYCYPFTKLYDTGTTLIENVSTGLKRGLFLDVFPLDGIGDGVQADLKWFRKIKHLNQFYLARICAVRKGRSFFKNLAVILAKMLPDRMANNRAMRIRISEMCRRYSFDQSRWAGSLLGNWWEREIMPRENFGDPKEYMFEGHKILGVENAEGYLTAIYGDWRRLPPEEKRATHHDFVLCDLHRSYLKD